MPSERIEVLYVNDPKVPNGPGSIKTATGEYYKVWPKRIPLNSFAVKGTYIVDYEEDEYQGKTQRTVTRVRPSIVGNAGNVAAAVVKTYRQQMAPQERNVVGVLALMKAWNGNPPEVTDGVAALDRCADILHAWQSGRGAEPYKVQSGNSRPPLNEEMGDELPDSL